MIEYLFVYGLLKSNGRLSYLLERAGAYLAIDKAMTKEGYSIYDLGGYPVMKRDLEKGGHVIGEVWDTRIFSQEDWELMDIVEAHYERETIQVLPLMLDAHRYFDAFTYIYLGDIDKDKKLSPPVWNNV